MTGTLYDVRPPLPGGTLSAMWTLVWNPLSLAISTCSQIGRSPLVDAFSISSVTQRLR